MKLPHPIKKARVNREKMKQEAQNIVENYDKGTEMPPVNSKIIWFVFGGFFLVFILQCLSKLIGE